MTGLITCQEYAERRGVAVPTVTLHARKLGIKKMAGVYVFTPKDVERLNASIVGKVGRPKKTDAPGFGRNGPEGRPPGAP